MSQKKPPGSQRVCCRVLKRKRRYLTLSEGAKDSEKAKCRLCQQQLQNSLYDKSVMQINIYANLLKDERLIAIQKQCLACDTHDGELSGGRLCVCLALLRPGNVVGFQ